MWEDLKPEEIIMGTDGLSSWVAEDKQKTPQKINKSSFLLSSKRNEREGEKYHGEKKYLDKGKMVDKNGDKLNGFDLQSKQLMMNSRN